MPVSTLGFSTSPVFGQHGTVTRSSASASTSSGAGVESSIVLNRVANRLQAPAHAGTDTLDTATLALQLRRHERKRQLMRFGAYKSKSEDGEGKDDKNANNGSSITSDTATPSSSPSSSNTDPEEQRKRFSRELDQWLRKMRCSGVTANRLDTFRDIRVGVCPDPVERGAPSIEPFPSRYRETEEYKFRGGRNAAGNFQGRGVVEFENGDLITGFFEDGRRKGEFRVETFKNKLRVIIGNYERDQLNGKARITYNDDTFMEGYFKDGVLHGFARFFDETGRLTFLGNHKNGRPHGVCWKVIKGGGCVVGRVDGDGELTGIRVAYLYPDFCTALVGVFSDGILERAQAAALRTVIDDRGVKVPIFSEPDGPVFVREIAGWDHVTDFPLLRDPYESAMVEVRPSKVSAAGDGLFAKVKVEPNFTLAFYNGMRVRPKTAENHDNLDWNYNAYKIFDPANKNGTIDIPEEFRDIRRYCASLAHKTNHSFLPNAEFVSFDHPRFGIVPCLLATHDIEAGEEIFVHYGYELNGCPEWYEEAWLSGNFPVPDSMREEYKMSSDGENREGEGTSDDAALKDDQEGAEEKSSIDGDEKNEKMGDSLNDSDVNAMGEETPSDGAEPIAEPIANTHCLDEDSSVVEGNCNNNGMEILNDGEETETKDEASPIGNIFQDKAFEDTPQLETRQANVADSLDVEALNSSTAVDVEAKDASNGKLCKISGSGDVAQACEDAAPGALNRDDGHGASQEVDVPFENDASDTPEICSQKQSEQFLCQDEKVAAESDTVDKKHIKAEECEAATNDEESRENETVALENATTTCDDHFDRGNEVETAGISNFAIEE